MIAPTPVADFKAFSVTEVANQLGVSRATIDRAITSGALRAVRLGTGKHRAKLRILATDLNAFLTRQSTTPPPKPTKKRKRRDADFIEYYT